MKISEFNLSYCLNAFDFTSDWKYTLTEIDRCFNTVREMSGFSSDKMTGLGFWTSEFFLELMRDPDNFRYLQEFLEKRNYYISTVNAFPYGVFHNQPVKDKVYMPNWLNEKRVDFTIKAAEFLEKFLPDGGSGSISTLPGAYRRHIRDYNGDSLRLIARNLEKTAEYLAYLYEKTGKKIRLGIEMEPDCIWETPDEFAGFYKKYMLPNRYSREYIGVCYDTCHQELIENGPGAGLEILERYEIPVVKIQLSAALQIQNGAKFADIKEFDEPVYLHQTRIFNEKNGTICETFSDIPELRSYSGDDVTLKCHFHLPLFWDSDNTSFKSARKELLAVIRYIKANPGFCRDLEIETYTYSVLPDCVDFRSIGSAVSKEYDWVVKCLM
jgi:hypothetical protein